MLTQVVEGGGSESSECDAADAWYDGDDYLAARGEASSDSSDSQLSQSSGARRGRRGRGRRRKASTRRAQHSSASSSSSSKATPRSTRRSETRRVEVDAARVEQAFEQVAGLEPQLAALEEMVLFPLKHPELYASLGFLKIRGVFSFFSCDEKIRTRRDSTS